MAEIVGVKVQLDGGEAIKTVGSLRQQLKSALTDLQGIQEEFGDISPQAIQAAKSVAELRDRIKDSNEVASLFDPEKKFQAVVGVAQGIASGFAAAQGAMALFGAESKEVEQALLKVQATMALAQGLSGIKAAAEDFKRLGAVLSNIGIIQKANAAANALAAGTMRLFGAATTQTATAFNVLKGAIVATGVGALVVLIGTLVQKMMSLADATDEAAEKQREYNKAMQDFGNAASDSFKEIAEQERDLAIARAKARGASEAEIVEITKKANKLIYDERVDNYLKQEVAGLNAAEAQKKVKEQETANEIYNLSVQQKAREDAEKASETAAAKSKAAREKDDAAAKAAAEQKAADQKALGETFNQALEEDKQAFVQSNEDKKASEKALADFQIETANIAIEDKKKKADEAALIEQAELEHKQAMYFAAANLLQGLSSLAGEQTVAGKVLAIAGATIATYASAQQAYWAAFNPVPTYLSPVLGALYAGAAVATGLANIRRIAAIQVAGKSGGGSVPAISNTTAPLSPQRPTTTTTRLDQETVNGIGNAVPARAYVVESDISKAQARMDRIHRAAKFE